MVGIRVGVKSKPAPPTAPLALLLMAVAEEPGGEPKEEPEEEVPAGLGGVVLRSSEEPLVDLPLPSRPPAAARVQGCSRT